MAQEENRKNAEAGKAKVTSVQQPLYSYLNAGHIHRNPPTLEVENFDR